MDRCAFISFSLTICLHRKTITGAVLDDQSPPVYDRTGGILQLCMTAGVMVFGCSTGAPACS